MPTKFESLDILEDGKKIGSLVEATIKDGANTGTVEVQGTWEGALPSPRLKPYSVLTPDGKQVLARGAWVTEEDGSPPKQRVTLLGKKAKT